MMFGMVMNEKEHKESLEEIKKETARRLVLNSGNNAVWMLERELAKNHRVIDRAQHSGHTFFRILV